MAASDRLVLVVNAGSSSLKFKLFTDAAAGLRGAVSGLVERIGDVKNSRIITTDLTADDPEKTAVDRGVKVGDCTAPSMRQELLRIDGLQSHSKERHLHYIHVLDARRRTTRRRWTTCCSI